MNPPAQETLQLRDIHLPETPDFWPPAPGWWIATAVMLGVLIWIGLVAWRHARIRRQRKHILDLLEQLERSPVDAGTPDYLAQLSQLMRRIALMRFPRRAVASLAGRDWLGFLDESGGDGRFRDGPGQVLAEGPYIRDLPDDFDSIALALLVRDWIKKNTHG